MTKEILGLTSLCLSAGLLPAADPPNAEITNGEIRAKIYLPDAKNGYYRGTRFDWSGVICSLQYKGHDYYGPWFNKTDPKVHDFVYQGPDIIAGPVARSPAPSMSSDRSGGRRQNPAATSSKSASGRSASRTKASMTTTGCTRWPTRGSGASERPRCH